MYHNIYIHKIGGVSFLYIYIDSLLINVSDIKRIQSVESEDQSRENVFIHTSTKVYKIENLSISEFFSLLGIIECPEKEEEPKEDVLSMKVDESEMYYNIRFRKVFEQLGIVTIGDLVQRSESELLRTPKFGHKTLRAVKESLKEYGLRLKDE